VLLSGATHELVRNDAPKDAVFSDLGLHRLKDLAQPERVWQVTVKDLRSDFPALKSLDTLPNNLPMQVTSFLGREQDLEAVKTHLTDHRLVTLCGTGGVGKTRLAMQIGADLLERFTDGVWIADLAPITDPESVASVVAQALGVRQAQDRPIEEAICHSLKGKQVLLVLDSCEHVLDRVAALADAIHHTCPNVRILVTSRQPLDVGGEKVLRLDSLRVSDSVALFADRALLVNQTFCLNDENAQVVEDICRRLDGIPLAIELAAARCKVLSVSNIDQRLNERFKILTGGNRTALPRQKTLAALFDWSYDLLSEQERHVFNRVAIFAGSFSMDGAIFVCAGTDPNEADLFDIIASLADKSLIVADTGGNQERYRLLESTRAYALEKLAETEGLEPVAGQHAEYFLKFAQTAETNFGTMPLSNWLAQLEPEMENIRATLEWALARGQNVALGAAIASALEMLWWHGGLEAEGRRWVGIGLRKIDDGTNPDAATRLRRTLALLTSRVLYS
jgi:predicted ATPase